MVTCQKCVRYAMCVAEAGSELDTEAIDCKLYSTDKHVEVPCVDCKHYKEVSGRLVQARCLHTGTAFLRFQMGEETAVLDPKVHTCREAVPKSQTVGKEG